MSFVILQLAPLSLIGSQPSAALPTFAAVARRSRPNHRSS
jgi:hypothetical protein